MSPEADARRTLPQVDRLAADLAPEFADLPRPLVIDAVRTVVEAARRRARRTRTVPSADEVLAAVRDELTRRRTRLLRPVVNATGVILHTNLGRAPLSEQAIDAVAQIARGYSSLEWDVERGRRGDRFAHVEPMLAVATGAEAAFVVNNNAAAVLLVCAALGTGRDVVISRGELIEIGGEFRIPDVIATSGARLREVGTTNRTRAADYEKAISDDTAFILKVHPSNYRVVGFTAAPSVDELSAVARAHGVPLVYDVGSGLLERELADEPVVSTALTEGADLVCFSGDKLFGGPQAGVIVGTTDLVSQLRAHPLVRALRSDKMQLAALGATVKTYLEGGASDLPVWKMIDADPAAILRRARRLVRALKGAGYEAETITGESVTGGGSLPGAGIATTLVGVRHPKLTPKELGEALRGAAVPVVARVGDGMVVIDLRTVLPGQDALVTDAFARITREPAPE